jgi:Na+-transporting NADH:ubiquinone oxidoreductase subunit C
LGARITEANLQARYIGKKLYDESGSFQSVVMQKGETGNFDSDPHKVNGMTGATITGVGVNQMMEDYVNLYKNYLNTVKK